jgi:chromate transporter
MPEPAEPPPSPPPSQPSPLAEVAGLMLKLGFTAFGGPAAHVAMMREEVVNRRRWVSEEQFLDLLGAAGLIPGPTSTEMAIHVGMTRAGVGGLWVAGFCFITPAVLITLGFAWAYVAFGGLPPVQEALSGIKPAVVAIIAVALVQLGRAAGKTVPLAMLGLAALALYLRGVSEIALLLGCGVLGVLLRRPWQREPSALAAFVWLGLPAAASTAPAAPTAGAIFLYFLKIGSVLFGSGYVLLAFIQQGLVHDLGWLTQRQLMDAVAVGQFTPGPLFSTATFIGYVVGGWQGAIAASVGIFLPSFVFVWATHPLIRRLREGRWSAGFLDGINIGSVALMTGVLLQLAGSALGVSARSAGSATAWAILAVSLALLLRWKLNSAWVVLFGALAGLVARG